MRLKVLPLHCLQPLIKHKCFFSTLTFERAFSSVSMLVVLAMEGRPPTAIGVGRTMALAPPLPGALEAAAAATVVVAAAADEIDGV